MTRQDLIWDSLRSFAQKYGEKPNLVLMHPNFYQELLNEQPLQYGAILQDKKYIFGMQIIETLDLQKTEIKTAIS